MLAFKSAFRSVNSHFSLRCARYFGESATKYALYQWGSKSTLPSSSSLSVVPTPIPGFDKPILSLSVRSDHCAAVTTDGYLYTWGQNNLYQCGLGHCETVESPELVTTLQDFQIVQAVCGDSHTAALSQEGYVFVCGYGGSFLKCGALGTGDRSSQATPVVIDYFYNNGIRIQQLASGSNFMLALDEAGELYSWGSGKFGTLGNEDQRDRLEPVKSNFKAQFGKIINISCGLDASMIVTEDRKVYTWGRNQNAQLGLFGASYVGLGKKLLLPTLVELPAEERPIRGSMGMGCAAVICESGNVFWWGMNIHEEPYQEVVFTAGNDKKRHLDKGQDVDCGRGMIDLITESGRLLTWGDRGNHPFGVKRSMFPFSRSQDAKDVEDVEGLSSTDLLQATEVETVNQVGRVYKVSAGSTMAVAAVEITEEEK